MEEIVAAAALLFSLLFLFNKWLLGSPPQFSKLGQLLEQSDLEDPTLDIDEVLDIRRTPALFFGEQRDLNDERPSKEGESSVLFENKFKSANLVTIGILILLCVCVCMCVRL